MKRQYTILVLSILMLFSFASISHAEYHPVNHRINSSGHVIWADAFRDIYLYNGSTIMKLTGGSSMGGSPQLNDLGHAVWVGNNELSNDNGHIVWMGQPDESYYDVFYYNGSTILRLTDDESPDKQRRSYCLAVR